MEVVGYLSSVLIGISLGLIGAGGGILTVPVLVYLFSVDATAATAYSLFIVGLTSAVGSVSYFRKGLVDLRTALLFGIPSIFVVLLTRTFLVESIPAIVFRFGSYTVSKNMLIMLLFAVLMVFASFSMIRRSNSEDAPSTTIQPRYTRILMQGAGVGLVTGIMGAGGGFLIIPALVLLLKIPMKTAIGTSLLIIATNSLIGFAASSALSQSDWKLLMATAATAVVGMFIGTAIGRKLNGAQLKSGFGWFVLSMGLFILFKETVASLNHIP